MKPLARVCGSLTEECVVYGSGVSGGATRKEWSLGMQAGSLKDCDGK